MNTNFQVGDTIYFASAVWTGEETDCPVCAGQGAVLIKPAESPDSEGHKHLCRYCDPRGEGTGGKVTDVWSYLPKVSSIVIEGIATKNVAGKITTDYLYNIGGGCYNSIEQSNYRIFATQKEAEKAAKAIAEKANADKESELREVRENHDSISWDVGYNKKQIKEEERALKKAQLVLQNAQWTVNNHIARIERIKCLLCE